MKLLFAVLLMSASLSLSANERVHEYKLDNGLKLIVKEDHRAPVMVSQVWYKIGSSYEHGGTTGVSHALEHMMFKATDHMKAGEFSRIIAENGGTENAFTGQDYTAYFQQMANDRLPVSFKGESDRMRHLHFDDNDIMKELEVIKEERRLRTDDKPNSLLQEQFMAAAYTTSPYRLPVIGWMNDLDNLQPQDLRDWYKKWYAPNNAIVVVVGDVQPAEVYKLAQKYFGPLKAEKISPPKPQIEPAQLGERRIQVKAPAKQAYMIMGYKVPTLGGGGEPWEAYALEVLAQVLDGGSSSRLDKELVRGQRLAASASADYSAYERMSSLFTMSGIASKDHTLADVEAALLKQIERLKKEPVTQAELDRVQAGIIASEVYELDSVFYQAMKIGMLEAMGFDWRLLEDHLQHIKQVTPQQVQAVAKKYLTHERLSVAVLDPQPIDPNKPKRKSTVSVPNY